MMRSIAPPAAAASPRARGVVDGVLGVRVAAGITGRQNVGGGSSSACRADGAAAGWCAAVAPHEAPSTLDILATTSRGLDDLEAAAKLQVAAGKTDRAVEAMDAAFLQPSVALLKKGNAAAVGVCTLVIPADLPHGGGKLQVRRGGCLWDWRWSGSNRWCVTDDRRCLQASTRASRSSSWSSRLRDVRWRWWTELARAVTVLRAKCDPYCGRRLCVSVAPWRSWSMRPLAHSGRLGVTHGCRRACRRRPLQQASRRVSEGVLRRLGVETTAVRRRASARALRRRKSRTSTVPRQQWRRHVHGVLVARLASCHLVCVDDAIAQCIQDTCHTSTSPSLSSSPSIPAASKAMSAGSDVTAMGPWSASHAVSC